MNIIYLFNHYYCEIDYYSSSRGVATVEGGKITAVGPETATITYRLLMNGSKVVDQKTVSVTVRQSEAELRQIEAERKQQEAEREAERARAAAEAEREAAAEQAESQE